MAATKARFQSTHPRGVRLAPLNALLTAILEVSIHAPAWGATCAFVTTVIFWTLFQSTHPRGVRPWTPRSASRAARSFNPRTRVGCDLLMTTVVGSSGSFQSTHPRGVRRWVLTERPVALLFQSTHPRGVRPAGRRKRRRARDVSIHAPAWGATSSMETVAPLAVLFQSTHPRGVRLWCWSKILRGTKFCFNPRTRVGCDP